MRRLGKLLVGVGAVVLVAVVGLGATVQLRWDRTFEVEYPEVRASTDSAVIARGRYLAYGPAHCAYCHVPNDQVELLEAGEEPPLAGGHVFSLPPGTIHTPNLTPDEETGIGRRTDAELARLIRHGVRADDRVAFPMMEFQNLSEEDLVALVSFLRAQAPVRNDVPEHQYSFLGKAILTFVLKPQGPESTPPAAAPPEGATVERGAYLVSAVAQCAACHTSRDLRSGQQTGPRLAGGMEMMAEDGSGNVLVTPNLTADPETGIMASWTEDQFVARFRAGKAIPGSPMPWGAFGKMSDEDLRAVYRYLRSVEPVVHDVAPVVRRPEA